MTWSSNLRLADTDSDFANASLFTASMAVDAGLGCCIKLMRSVKWISTSRVDAGTCVRLTDRFFSVGAKGPTPPGLGLITLLD